jgi:hypothetical protein
MHGFLQGLKEKFLVETWQGVTPIAGGTGGRVADLLAGRAKKGGTNGSLFVPGGQ